MTSATGTGQGNSGIQSGFQSGQISITSFTDTSVVANGTTFTGTGFSYTSSVQGGTTIYQPTGGTITGISKGSMMRRKVVRKLAPHTMDAWGRSSCNCTMVLVIERRP